MRPPTNVRHAQVASNQIAINLLVKISLKMALVDLPMAKALPVPQARTCVRPDPQPPFLAQMKPLAGHAKVIQPAPMTPAPHLSLAHQVNNPTQMAMLVKTFQQVIVVTVSVPVKGESVRQAHVQLWMMAQL